MGWELLGVGGSERCPLRCGSASDPQASLLSLSRSIAWVRDDGDCKAVTLTPRVASLGGHLPFPSGEVGTIKNQENAWRKMSVF